MPLVLRCNYGDESIALIAHIFNQKQQGLINETVYVAYVETGWEANFWLKRVENGELWVQSLGFIPVKLKPKMSLPDMVNDRGSFPSKKFQWCAGFIKGLPLLNWLDNVDPQCEFTIAIPKRQVNYRKPIPEVIAECEYHGERQVIHPILNMLTVQRDKLIEQSGFTPLNHRSKECDPCVNSTVNDLKKINCKDIKKAAILEAAIDTPIFPKGIYGLSANITQVVEWAKHQPVISEKAAGDNFSMGCGDPFGCGL